jgi:3-dehydroquinate synthase
MNKFTIDGKEFKVESSSFKNKFVVTSHPKNYKVSFKKFSNDFKDNDILLIDKNVKEKYNINHNKIIVVEATEKNKSIETVLDISQKLTDYNFDKGNNLIVIGGGILQDLGAFTGKIFKRGINWIYYPTTLLSQCDSCIGGKTALNFKSNKNQLALFSAPNEVIIDLDFLDTLKEEDMISGYGEIVKLFLIGGNYYADNYDNFNLKELIYHSLMIKKAVIDYDEFENNERKSLNLGHSFGHIIEPMTDYKISHGKAVMLGTLIINKLFFNENKTNHLISKFTSLVEIKNLDKSLLVRNLKTDKKVKNGNITFVVIEKPGITKFIKRTIDENLEKDLHEVFIN